MVGITRSKVIFFLLGHCLSCKQTCAFHRHVYTHFACAPLHVTSNYHVIEIHNCITFKNISSQYFSYPASLLVPFLSTGWEVIGQLQKNGNFAHLLSNAGSCLGVLGRVPFTWKSQQELHTQLLIINYEDDLNLIEWIICSGFGWVFYWTQVWSVVTAIFLKKPWSIYIYT